MPVRQIELPNGGTLIMQANTKGPRIIVITKGLSIGAEILPENEFDYGTDEWANKEIELFENALDIDLKAHSDFIKECLRKPGEYPTPIIS